MLTIAYIDKNNFILLLSKVAQKFCLVFPATLWKQSQFTVLCSEELLSQRGCPRQERRDDGLRRWWTLRISSCYWNHDGDWPSPGTAEGQDPGLWWEYYQDKAGPRKPLNKLLQTSSIIRSVSIKKIWIYFLKKCRLLKVWVVLLNIFHLSILIAVQLDGGQFGPEHSPEYIRFKEMRDQVAMQLRTSVRIKISPIF